MRLFKLLTTTLFTFLALPFSSSLEYPNNDINAYPVLSNFNPISPSFALQLVEDGLNILTTTFNDPQNSFNIMIDPTLRKNFLEQILMSVDNLQNSLSQIISNINLPTDITTLNNINTQIDSLFNSVTNRIETYLLTDENTYYIYDGLVRDIFSSRYNVSSLIDQWNKIEIPNKDTYIYLPEIYHNLTKFDLTTIYSRIDSFPPFNSNSISSSPVVMIKISDIDGIVLTLNNTVILSLPYIPVDGYKTFCGIWNDVSNKWDRLISVNDGMMVNCSIPSSSSTSIKSSSTTNQDFYTVSLFSTEDVSKNDNKAVIILATVIPSFFLIIAGIVGWRYYKRRREYHDITASVI